MKIKTDTRKTYSYKTTYLAAVAILEVLLPVCERLEIAGSLRRGKDPVHDIDLVGWARYRDVYAPTLFGERQALLSPPVELLNAIRQLDVRFVDPPAVDPKALHFVYHDRPVEVYLAERDGSNYYALLQMRTGGRETNEFLAGTARHKGLYYRAGYGIYEHDDRGAKGDFGRRVDDGSEAGIFHALGVPYKKPNERN